ncbi:hypothetical protein FSP39_012860 [Pinctada imbricata]|uniref:Peroxisomal membrane protein PEX14 n=1 Tax=Pinctada imbricata TaxID=66713 RepID=A0AA88YUU1_PINIB|nr:hypothetical protein FSP39_012860 [Pinctada imbricata]
MHFLLYFFPFQPSSEISKEILAPADGPREEMITTAVKFLQNPKVQKSPLHQRKAFLERKGLTKEEIDMAVQRSGVIENPKGSQSYVPSPNTQATVPYQPMTQQPPMQVQVYSQWMKVRDILSVIALAGGLSYAVYRFYKRVLRPLLFGKSDEESRLDKVEQVVMEMQQNVVTALTKIQETLTALQTVVSKQDEKLQAITHEVFSKQSTEMLNKVQDQQFTTEIKSELTSIKGLLLNRKQFPPTPASTPLLPSWQLTTGITSPTTSTLSNSTRSLVTPSGDNAKQSEEATLNSNEKGDTNQADKPPEIQFSTESLASLDTTDRGTDENSDEKEVNEVKVTDMVTKDTDSDEVD